MRILLEEIEEILIQSDVGVATTTKIVDRMRKEARRQGAMDGRQPTGALQAIHRRDPDRQ